MRWPLVAALPLAILPIACIDIFYSTDFLGKCDIDAADEACAPFPDATLDGVSGDGNPGVDGGVNDGGADGADGDSSAPHDASDGATDFCAWSVSVAHDKARHACAWLGACAGPTGPNMFGVCLDDALRAYDCTIQPSRPVVGAAHAYWDCLSKVTKCGDVAKCVSSAACGASAAEQPVCAPGGTAVLDCPADSGGPPAAVLACVSHGQSCDITAPGYCTSAPGVPCPTTSTCGSNGQIIDCSGSTSVGVDCRLVGAGRCTILGDAGPACVPSSGAACDASAFVTCSGAVAVGCPAGQLEQVDCNQLLEGTGKCDQGTAGTGRPWDVARICQSNGSGPCTGDSCSADGTTLIACHRGQQVQINCLDAGLGACQPFSHLTLPTGYACVP